MYEIEGFSFHFGRSAERHNPTATTKTPSKSWSWSCCGHYESWGKTSRYVSVESEASEFVSEIESGSVNERKTECKIRWVRFCSCDFARRDDGGKRWRPSNGATRTRGRAVSWRHP